MARTGAENTFTGFDQKTRIVRRALYQCALHIEKLVVDPFERRPGMRTTVAVSKKISIVPHHETIDPLTGRFQRESE